MTATKQQYHLLNHLNRQGHKPRNGEFHIEGENLVYEVGFPQLEEDEDKMIAEVATKQRAARTFLRSFGMEVADDQIDVIYDASHQGLFTHIKVPIPLKEINMDEVMKKQGNQYGVAL